ncbi:MAG: hypothetical protein NTW03_05500 [Verrucomicrobia bacterium]|nr:hypothetical protein [Verrucomicrobiota bacterium]
MNTNTSVGGNTATLTLPSVTVAQSGSYLVVVTNGAGSAASASAQLLVVPAPAADTVPAFRLSQSSKGQFTLAFTTLPGYRYLLLTNSMLGTDHWGVLTNIPPSFDSLAITLPQSTATAPQLFYRVSVSNQ